MPSPPHSPLSPQGHPRVEVDGDCGDLPATLGCGPCPWLRYSKSRLKSCAEDSSGKRQICNKSYLPPPALTSGPTSPKPPLLSQREQNRSQEEAGLCYSEVRLGWPENQDPSPGRLHGNICCSQRWTARQSCSHHLFTLQAACRVLLPSSPP